MEAMWKQCWKEGNTKNRHLISDPTQRVPGFDCPRAIWTNLNRIRTEQSNCNYLLHKWKIKNSPYCVIADKYRYKPSDTLQRRNVLKKDTKEELKDFTKAMTNQRTGCLKLTFVFKYIMIFYHYYFCYC